MGLISQTISNLKGGISQQPEVLKFPEQGIEQVNGWSSETTGLQKRPPFMFKKILGAAGSFGPNPYIHFVNRDEKEQYYIIITTTGIKVFDINGNAQRVSGDTSYLRTSNPREELKVQTVADYTFIVNTKKTIKASSKINLPNYNTKKEALINLRGGQYGRVLKVLINNVEYASYELPDGSKPEHVKKVDAQSIGTELARLINSKSSSLGNTVTATLGQGFIHIVASSSFEITSIKTADGYADQLINAVTHYVQTFNKLPLAAPDNYIVKVVGDTSKSIDAYYVKYSATEKVWKETVGWNTTMGLDSKTMPHALVSEGSGQFTFKQLEWSEKACGDDDTNPEPSFVDSTINDIFLYRNRLGFLSGENVILSRTGKYFNFFPASIASLADEDPVDISVSSDRISILKYAIPFSSELLLWSDESQFVLSSEGAFSAQNMNLNLVSNYDMSDKARPYAIGKGVYYANPRAGYASIYRYYEIQQASLMKSSEDMTSYVPNYIPEGVFSIRGSTVENYCSILTKGAPNKIFMYKFFYIDEKLVQQAWSHWDFGSNVEVLACDAVGSTMYPIIQNGTHIMLGHMTFTQETKDFADEPYRLYLDAKRRFTIPSSKFDDTLYETHIKLKDIYGTSNTPFEKGKVIVITKTGLMYEFEPKGEKWNDDEELIFNGNVSEQVMFIGLAIPFKYQFSRFLIKQFDNNGKVQTVDVGRLQLRRAWINHQESGSYTVTVTKGGTTYSYVMTGKQIGDRDHLLGSSNITTGQFKFPCTGSAPDVKVEVFSDTPTQIKLIGCGWEGLYVRRSTNI